MSPSVAIHFVHKVQMMVAVVVHPQQEETLIAHVAVLVVDITLLPELSEEDTFPDRATDAQPVVGLR